MVARPGDFVRDSATPGGAADAGSGRCRPSRRFSRLTVLSGPSGVGKSTVVAELRRVCPQIWLSVSVTTRPPRPGEVDGREYYFVDNREFDRMVAAGELLEWAEFAGNRYGTPRKPLEEKLAAGVPCLLEIDLAGARQVRRSMPDARLIFLAPPSWDELVRRLTGRGTEPPEVVQRRLEAARRELAAESEFDITIVNTSVEEVCRQVIALIFGSPDEQLAVGVIQTEGVTWQGPPPQTASSIRRSTSFSRSWTASTSS
jgi:guanylate kinase